ncbi:MAG TPA: MmcQ/YjbR family DNA-binding protein [Steroidobacteraceae bacterium]|nr:MmcQ/YjbR family DNA-binding protein [Steroidobacteraceae bacterium]HRX88259.1 MmcQ/YjbR family DNA-binding protein [Steroidobacteraceae bacterium]
MPAGAANDVGRALRELCLAFPRAEEKKSHGMLTFRVGGGKVFLMHAVNHHGDGRVALWLPMPDGAQGDYVADEPQYFFVPPYVGPRGWLGVRLDNGLAWRRISELVRMAYEQVAPPKFAKMLGRTPVVPTPRQRVTARDTDPARTPRGKAVLTAMRSICLALPETSEGTQFGSPVWRAGKKVFAQAYCYEKGWRVAFWVGVEQQSLLTRDPRYSIPAYLGHNGWIALDVSRSHRVGELCALAESSYRHFALKRMLAQL